LVIDKDILEIIDSGRSEGNKYYLPSIQLERSMYTKVNKVLEALEGKWSKKEKAHIFPSNIEDIIDNVLLTGEVIDKKKEFQFFETPPELARELVEYAEVDEDMLCLEPSAGSGNIANALAKITSKENIICIELQKNLADNLCKLGYKTAYDDFLKIISPDNSGITTTAIKYDRIVMNPPFTKQQDIEHVIHALKFLKNDGILVSVMTPAINYRTNKKTLQFLELLSHYDYEILELPEDSFKSSGTSVNTIAIKIKKGD